MKLHLILMTLALSVAATGCKSGAKVEPSRGARSGCQWVASGEAALGVTFLVEECGGKRPAVSRKANVIEIGEGGARIEVYGKHFAQPAITAIKEHFVSRLSEQEFAGCIVTAKPENVKAPVGMNLFAIVPGPDYLAAAKAKRDADPAAMVCGDHGQGPVQGLFMADQANAGGRLLYVFAGGAESGLDVLSVRLESDKSMVEKLEKLTPENLATAELLAFALESDLKRFKEAKGQYAEGDKESSYTLFSRDGQPVVAVEQVRISDKSDSAVRSYFTGGRLFLVRQNELLNTRGGIARSQDVVWKRIAFGADGKVLEARKVVQGVAAALEPAEVEEAAKAAAGLVKRAAK